MMLFITSFHHKLTITYTSPSDPQIFYKMIKIITPSTLFFMMKKKTSCDDYNDD